jgi:Flp pilus assembly protein TadG
MRRGPGALPRRQDRDRGATAVEFALVLPIFLLLVCGVIDFARAYNAQVTLSEAAAEGARTLAIGSSSGEAQTAVETALQGSTVPPDQVTYPEIVACPSDATPGGAQASIEVQTTGFGPITPLMEPIIGELTITGTAARQCYS